MIRAVIDTNVVVSALLSPDGNESLVLLAVFQDMLRLCVSEPILKEYSEVLARPKFSFPLERIARLIAVFHEKGEAYLTVTSDYASPDPTDTKFLNCAHAAQASFLVTGNKRHFPDSPYGSTRVVSAAELLDYITLEL